VKQRIITQYRFAQRNQQADKSETGGNRSACVARWRAGCPRLSRRRAALQFRRFVLADDKSAIQW
jgi:hypothetical protein